MCLSFLCSQPCAPSKIIAYIRHELIGIVMVLIVLIVVIAVLLIHANKSGIFRNGGEGVTQNEGS